MKRSPLKRSRTKISEEEHALRYQWWDGRFSDMDPHHIIPRQQLRKRGLPLAVQWDTRNRMWLPRKAHADHHSRHRPIKRSELPAGVFEFAAEHGLTGLLERIYPDE